MVSLAALCLGIASMSFIQQPTFAEPSFLGFLVTGKNPPKATTEEIQGYQRAHIENFKRLHGDQKLATAGPMADPTKLKRGIVVLCVKEKSEIPSLFQADPYVAKGFMELQIHAIKPVFGKIHTEGIDPNGIEENRIVLFSPVDGARSDASLDLKQLEHLKSAQTAGLAFYALVQKSGDYQAVALFLGKNDADIQKWIDDSPMVKLKVWSATKMPQWLGKGVIRVPKP
jgi:uncharacterized protein YciI